MKGCMLMCESSFWGYLPGADVTFRNSYRLLSTTSSTSQPVCFHLSFLDIQADYVSA